MVFPTQGFLRARSRRESADIPPGGGWNQGSRQWVAACGEDQIRKRAVAR